ncbi:AraC family transcriptional regulator [Gilvimarinus sp. F26214L]|uniref:AraC family transcriptional regulator n=1 Tax=Gilvimarinus sp. DZF01 TaxID=3461371 RepID=UPI00404624EB
MSDFTRTAGRIVCALACISFASWSTAAPVTSPGTEGEKNIEFGAEEVKSATQSAMEEVQAISKGIQTLKSQVVDLNKDLRLMEEKILFPSATKYSVFVSMAAGHFFDLESIKFKLDGKLVTSHVYSEKQREALVRGGVHRLYVTNLSEGQHTVTVFFTGLGSNERPYKRAVSLDFDKGPGSGYLEIAISDDPATQEPVFELKQW